MFICIKLFNQNQSQSTSTPSNNHGCSIATPALSVIQEKPKGNTIILLLRWLSLYDRYSIAGNFGRN